jgi:hypothetical protein
MVSRPPMEQNKMLRKHYKEYKIDFKEILVVRKLG